MFCLLVGSQLNTMIVSADLRVLVKVGSDFRTPDPMTCITLSFDHLCVRTWDGEVPA